MLIGDEMGLGKTVQVNTSQCTRDLHCSRDYKRRGTCHSKDGEELQMYQWHLHGICWLVPAGVCIAACV